jgi:ADP-heptose:LPS heptosyltransferase
MTKRLFLTFEAMGDTVMRCGALRELAASSTLDLAGRRYLNAYADSPWIGRVIDARCLARRRQPWMDRWLSGRMQLAKQLRSANYDEVIIYQRDGDRGLRAWLSRRLPTARIREIPREGLPAATWSSVINQLLASDQASGIILIGSTTERSMAQSIVDGVTAGYRDRVTMAAVGLDIPETAALIRAAQLLISVDTGPAHIAAAVGARVLVLFGPTSQRRFAPRGPGVVRTLAHDVPCRPCFGTPRAKRCSDNICLRLMPVEQIVATARSMLP